VDARELFRLIAETNWDFAEPGALFWDRIFGWNLLSNTKEFSYAGVNPCGEEPLPAGGSCLLGQHESGGIRDRSFHRKLLLISRISGRRGASA
jgi:ribonucleotide reductase alpha subunit